MKAAARFPNFRVSGGVGGLFWSLIRGVLVFTSYFFLGGILFFALFWSIDVPISGNAESDMAGTISSSSSFFSYCFAFFLKAFWSNSLNLGGFLNAFLIVSSVSSYRNSSFFFLFFSLAASSSLIWEMCEESNAAFFRINGSPGLDSILLLFPFTISKTGGGGGYTSSSLPTCLTFGTDLVRGFGATFLTSGGLLFFNLMAGFVRDFLWLGLCIISLL